MSSFAIDNEMDELENSIKELRILYEKYIAGLDRVEPLKQRDAVKKQLRRMMTDNVKNTARRFRMQTLNASVITYEQYWNRVSRQMEEGTFRRDKHKAEKLQEETTAAKAEVSKVERLEPVAAPPDDKRFPEPIRKLHEAFVQAKKKLGQQDLPEIDVFAVTLQQQYVAIKQKFKCENVEFKIAEKDGRVILKAIPK